VIITLSSLIDYLQEFTLASSLHLTQNFSHFSSKHHMLLNGNTLANLEILCNETDYTVKGFLFFFFVQNKLIHYSGSLLWILDHTITTFGKRLLRKWVSQPLLDIKSGFSLTFQLSK